jgi:hypothetical protein
MPGEALLRVRHYKGGVYEILGGAQHTEGEEVLVIYRAEGSAKWWARPTTVFWGIVQHEGRSVPRFATIPLVEG